jgi:myo-inositol-1(or 4)-monophosphatase
MNLKRLNAAKTAALITGKMLLDQFKNGNRSGFLKGDQTLVTESDQEADRMIQDLILGEFPEDQILSEERDTIFPDNKHVWIIDPLDGTVNFSHGLGYWGVSIAHLEDGHPQTAALYFPVTGELFSAVRDGGAELNGKKLQVSCDYEDNLFPIFVHCSRMGERYQEDFSYKKRSLGSAAYHLCLIAKNTAILGFESTPRIWDFSGSWLIVKEAGGIIESIGEDQPFPAQAGTNYQKISYPIAAAVSQKVMDKAKDKIIRH